MKESTKDIESTILETSTDPACPRATDGSVIVPVRGMYIGISDIVAAMLNIQEKVHSARYRIRDDVNRITWFNDRLQGLTPNSAIYGK